MWCIFKNKNIFSKSYILLFSYSISFKCQLETHALKESVVCDMIWFNALLTEQFHNPKCDACKLHAGGYDLANICTQTQHCHKRSFFTLWSVWLDLLWKFAQTQQVDKSFYGHKYTEFYGNKHILSRWDMWNNKYMK